MSSAASTAHAVVVVSETGARYDDVSIVLSALAWIMTPGNVFDLSTGTSLESPRIGAVAPMSTTLFRKRAGLTLPSSTSAALITLAALALARPDAKLSRRRCEPSVGTRCPPTSTPSGRIVIGPVSPFERA